MYNLYDLRSDSFNLVYTLRVLFLVFIFTTRRPSALEHVYYGDFSLTLKNFANSLHPSTPSHNPGPSLSRPLPSTRVCVSDRYLNIIICWARELVTRLSLPDEVIITRVERTSSPDTDVYK